MCQFAGYQQEDGSVVGDPAAVGITKVAPDMGITTHLLYIDIAAVLREARLARQGHQLRLPANTAVRC